MQNWIYIKNNSLIQHSLHDNFLYYYVSNKDKLKKLLGSYPKY